MYDNCSVIKAQSQYAIISYSIRHGLTGTALNDLLKLIDIQLPEGTDFARSKYLLMKHLLTNEGQLEYHAVCLNCPDSYIGTEDAECPKCNTLIVVKDCVKSGDFFTVFKLREQIKALLDDPATSKHLNIRERRQYCDNYPGSRYEALPLRPDDLSLTFNTDGVPVFEDSKRNLYPILASINELPYPIRRRSILVAALWFGKSKPDMNMLFTPFVRAMQALQYNRISWSDNGNERNSRVFLGAFSCDAVARCAVQNMMHSNCK